MKAAFPDGARTPGEPCTSVSMHSEGRYAFVELKSSEMASAALQLSGQVQLLGQNISVGRPSGYVDPSAAQMAAAQAATALQAFEVQHPFFTPLPSSFQKLPETWQALSEH